MVTHFKVISHILIWTATTNCWLTRNIVCCPLGWWQVLDPATLWWNAPVNRDTQSNNFDADWNCWQLLQNSNFFHVLSCSYDSFWCFDNTRSCVVDRIFQRIRSNCFMIFCCFLASSQGNENTQRSIIIVIQSTVTIRRTDSKLRKLLNLISYSQQNKKKLSIGKMKYYKKEC